VVGLCLVVVAGCGGNDPPKLPTEHVRLSVTAPVDRASVRRGTVDVQGRVSPKRSEVAVLGRPALVTDGRFTVVVPLEPGMNVIDVAATAPRRLPALTAVRVTRDVLVTVPELSGLLENELDSRLEPLGLRADVTRGGGLFDLLRGGDPRVCEQSPQPGARVRRGRVVDVIIARKC
jgi:hypothetical protein